MAVHRGTARTSGRVTQITTHFVQLRAPQVMYVRVAVRRVKALTAHT